MESVAPTARQVQTARHEAAHALACCWYDVRIERVTVRPAPGYLGAVWHDPVPNPWADLVIACAGFAAVSPEGRNWLIHGEDATAIHECLAKFPTEEQDHIFREAAGCARGLVSMHRHLVNQLADELLSLGEMSGRDVEAFINYWGGL